MDNIHDHRQPHRVMLHNRLAVDMAARESSCKNKAQGSLKRMYGAACFPVPTLLQRLMLLKMTALILHIVGNANSDTLFLKVISPLFLLSTRFPPKLALPFLSSLERPTRPTPDGRPRRIVSRRRDGRRRASTWRPLGLTL